MDPDLKVGSGSELNLFRSATLFKSLFYHFICTVLVCTRNAIIPLVEHFVENHDGNKNDLKIFFKKLCSYLLVEKNPITMKRLKKLNLFNHV